MNSRDDIYKEIVEIVRNVSEKPHLELTEESEFSNIDNWDSLNTVDMEIDIEVNMDIDFDIGEFKNYKTIRALVDAIYFKGTSKNPNQKNDKIKNQRKEEK